MSNRQPTMRDHTTQSGFGLLEGMAVLGVMTMMLVMVAQIFLVSYDAYAKQSARANNDSNAMLAARAMTEATRGAIQVLDSWTINGTTYTSSQTELVLKLPAVNIAGDIIADEYDYVAFYRDATETDKIFSDTEKAALSYRVNGQKKMTAHNSVLTFRYDNPDLTETDRVSIYLKNQQLVRGSEITTQAWSSIFLRNR